MNKQDPDGGGGRGCQCGNDDDDDEMGHEEDKGGMWRDTDTHKRCLVKM